MNRVPVLAALVGAVEDGQVLGAEVRRALDGLRAADRVVERLDLCGLSPRTFLQES
jgi:hypothetical protein